MLMNTTIKTQYYVQLPDGAIVADGFPSATAASLWGLSRTNLIGHSFEVYASEDTRRRVSVDTQRRSGIRELSARTVAQ